jgi:hypothetical protein
VVYAPVERADTLSLFLLYPYMFSVPQSTNAIMMYLSPQQLYHSLQQLQSRALGGKQLQLYLLHPVTYPYLPRPTANTDKFTTCLFQPSDKKEARHFCKVTSKSQLTTSNKRKLKIKTKKQCCQIHLSGQHVRIFLEKLQVKLAKCFI